MLFVRSWRAEGLRLWRPLLCDASVTTQRTVWGFCMRRRILDWGFSLLDGKGMG